MDMDIRALVRREVERQGMTRTGLAKLTGQTRAAVSDFLNGKREVRTDTLSRMLDVLGIVLKPTRKGRVTRGKHRG